MEKKTYYVYYLIDPRDNTVFYIGKGKNQRMYVHEQYVRENRNPHKVNKKLYNKIKTIHKNHYKVKYKKVFKTNDEQEAYKTEEEHQRKFGLENLCNIAYGGIPPSWKGKKHSEEARKKISESKKGKSMEEIYGIDESKELKERWSKTRKEKLKSGEIIPWNKGLTKETSERVRKNVEHTLYFYNSRKNKTYEEMYGIEKAQKIKKKKKGKNSGKNNGNYKRAKGKTYEEIYGYDRAKEIKEKKRNKTWEDIHGYEKAKQLKEKASIRFKTSNPKQTKIKNKMIEGKINNVSI